MNKNIKLIAGILVLGLFFTSCKDEKIKKVNPTSYQSSILDEESPKESASKNGLKRFDKTIYEYFDTVTTFTGYCSNKKDFEKYEDLVEARMEEYHKLFNNYDEFDGVNNITTINKNAGKKPVKVDEKIINLIKEGKKWYELTDGDINMAYGSVLSIWSDYREEGLQDKEKARLPKKDELNEKAQHTNIDAIEINEEEKTVFINDENIQIEVGGIAKGYATELIKDELIEKNLPAGLLSVGGDVAIIGANPEEAGREFKVAIQNPTLSKSDPYSAILSLKDTSVVTSGDYQRYYEVDGKRYHHIIDPKTNFPSTNFKSVSVILDDIAQADALSTALFIKNLEDGKKLLKEFNAEAMWIDSEGEIYKSDGWDNFDVSDQN